MESPSTAPWWRTVAARIEAEPLTLICAELGADPEQVLQALLDGDRPAQLSQASWWPELQRRSVEGEPIRSLARRFRLEPRRVRRALARAGLRVAGRMVAATGLPALDDWRGRLGAMPDVAIARAAKVPVDAVIGERRRLGLGAFLQRRQRRRALNGDGRPLQIQMRRPKPPALRPPTEPVVVRRPSRAAPPLITDVVAADDVLDARLGKLTPLKPAPAPPPGAISAPRRIVRPPRPTLAELTSDPETPSRARRR